MNKDNIYKGLNDLKQKRTRTELKSSKVNLSVLDDLSEQAGMAASNYEFGLEMFFEGREKLIGARDILRFEVPSPIDIADELNKIEDSLLDLGVDIPSELEDARNNLNYAIEQHNELIDEFRQLGIDPMTDRL
tara:strand:+ start:4564 stop:4962 length:399 start_codon:yes stop_codon:yes gene_type:complete